MGFLTYIKYYSPPSTDFIKPNSDITRLSKNDYCTEFIHQIDVLNNTTYFYPKSSSYTEGIVFNRVMTLKRVLQELPTGFIEEKYHLSYNQ